MASIEDSRDSKPVSLGCISGTKSALQKRQESLPKEITDIAWQAQLRLCRRYQRLKPYDLMVTAIAKR